MCFDVIFFDSSCAAKNLNVYDELDVSLSSFFPLLVLSHKFSSSLFAWHPYVF